MKYDSTVCNWTSHIRLQSIYNPYKYVSVDVKQLYPVLPTLTQFYPVKPGLNLVKPRFYPVGWVKLVKPGFLPTLHKFDGNFKTCACQHPTWLMA